MKRETFIGEVVCVIRLCSNIYRELLETDKISGLPFKKLMLFCFVVLFEADLFDKFC